MQNTLKHISTFAPPPNSRGEDGPEFVGTLRRGELRGIIRINASKCERCDVCTKVCPVGAITGRLGGVHSIDNERCVSCGQCLIACPFLAIEQMSFVSEVERMLADPELLVVAHPSPSLRVSIAEEFGAEPGRLSTAQLLNALELLGFHIYDVNSAADHTIMEEATEFARKIQYWVLGMRGDAFEHVSHHPLPHFTSCCPCWVRNAEVFHGDLLPHLSTARSPIGMGGPIAKIWGSEFLYHCDPRKIRVVAVTPCTGKIFEASRPELNGAWEYLRATGKIPRDTPSFPDVDAVLTARDIADLFRKRGINPLELSNERRRDNLEVYSGAGTIFGVSGGVMEAAIRTAYRILMGRELEPADIEEVRGYDQSVVEAKIYLDPPQLQGKTLELRVCVVNGALQGLEKVIELIHANPNRWHFIEVMNCPGGCINGGGQPVHGKGSAWLKPLMPIPIRFS